MGYVIKFLTLKIYAEKWNPEKWKTKANKRVYNRKKDQAELLLKTSAFVEHLGTFDQRAFGLYFYPHVFKQNFTPKHILTIFQWIFWSHVIYTKPCHYNNISPLFPPILKRVGKIKIYWYIYK